EAGVDYPAVVAGLVSADGRLLVEHRQLEPRGASEQLPRRGESQNAGPDHHQVESAHWATGDRVVECRVWGVGLSPDSGLRTVGRCGLIPLPPGPTPLHRERSDPMKVLLLTNKYPPHIYGGAGVHVEFLSRELAELMDVEVRCFGEQASTTHGRLRVRGYPPI